MRTKCDLSHCCPEFFLTYPVDVCQGAAYSGARWKKVGENGSQDPSSMFRGANKLTLDIKGRMVMPTRYRERLLERCGGKLVVTVDKDQCLLVYPMPDWEEIERKLMKLPSFNERARRLQRLMG